MELHRFALIVDRLPDRADAAQVADRHGDIFLAPGHHEVTVQRAALSLAEAVVSAVHDLEALDLQPVRVCDNDWVTLAHIAERIERSRELVRLWSIGRYGPGDFPPPLNPGRDTKFYSWTEVAVWLRRHMDVDVDRPDPTLVVANLLLQARRLAPSTRSREVLGNLVDSYRPTLK
ncbi:hypothetical protein ACTMTJ_17620 [Phytohabitans sp. LJ34]|uniref:hypothetical protein n=1 Tax=Phytohabitans sp. LJ34 TaxID=3452217 RepID=UPI003F8C96EF